jgi:hypothetical protein
MSVGFFFNNILCCYLKFRCFVWLRDEREIIDYPVNMGQNDCVDVAVDTLFKVKGIYVHFSLYGRDRNFIETRIIERFVIFQHPVNSVN